MIKRLVRWSDDRLGGTKFTRKALDKVFPDHWSFMLGEVAMYALMVLIGTGTYLAFFFHPGSGKVVYHGSYAPLAGVQVSQSYRSALELSFDVRSGLLVRQVHHWAALVFLFAIVLHLCRIYFTGAYRRPREINWLVGVTMLVLGILNGFTGYSMPDDLLSGTGLRIAHSILSSIPLAGPYLAFAIFGGEFPGNITPRLFVLHILVIPAAIIGLLSVHLAILWRQKHTQFAGRGRREDNVVGSRLWPTYAVRSVGLFLVVAGVLCALGALAQINPVWLYGPYRPDAVSTAAQPDWYLGWIEGAMRITPKLRWYVFGYRVPEVVWPAVVFPGLTFLMLYLWPAIDRFLTRDRDERHILRRPRDHPVRTALGVAVLSFYVVLFLAGSQDLIAQQVDLGIDAVIVTFRVALVVFPVCTALLAYKICRDLAWQTPADEFAETGDPPIAPTEKRGGDASVPLDESTRKVPSDSC